MKFRMKMTICMVWLLALAYGIGSSALITNTFNDTLRREQEAAYRSYHVAADDISFAAAFLSKSHFSRILSQLLSKSNPLALGFDLVFLFRESQVL